MHEPFFRSYAKRLEIEDTLFLLPNGRLHDKIGFRCRVPDDHTISNGQTISIKQGCGIDIR